MWYISHILTRKLGNCIYCIYIKMFPSTTTLVVYFFDSLLYLYHCPFSLPFFASMPVRRSLVWQGFHLFSLLLSVSCRRKSFIFFFPCLSSPIFPYILFLYILLLIYRAYIFYLPAGHGKFGSIFP